MDLWSVDQSKAAFFGLTAHWICADLQKNSPWSLCSQVVAFWGVFGAHNGENLGHYFVSLCKRASIITKMSPKLLCVTADNTSNNDIMCNVVERILHSRLVYSFDPIHHFLPYLTHVLNLAIVNVMSAITKIAAIETMTAIWEFDPLLPNNQLLGNWFSRCDCDDPDFNYQGMLPVLFIEPL